MNYLGIGKKIYDLKNWREAHRCLVFVIRCLLHPCRMQRLENFFNSTPLLKKIAAKYAFVYEQPTRAFFYNKSTFDERINIIKNHMSFMADSFNETDFIALYSGEHRILWESKDADDTLTFRLVFHPGQRKEGLLSLVLDSKQGTLYQMMFWINKNEDNEWSLWIGAMQGPNMTNAKDVIKKVTKRCHSYRTKNLILHATQELTKSLGLKHIYAVTNYGYYANNHIRRDRKLKTSFSDFWLEAGGKQCNDKRFFELPLTEYRKRMEEVPTRKRANYRRRYELLDEIDQAIKLSCLHIINRQC